MWERSFVFPAGTVCSYLGRSENPFANVYPKLGPRAPEEHLERSGNFSGVGEPQPPADVDEARRRAPHDGVQVRLDDRTDACRGNCYLRLIWF